MHWGKEGHFWMNDRITACGYTDGIRTKDSNGKCFSCLNMLSMCAKKSIRMKKSKRR